ncbi:hypothetical protein FQ186_24070 [Pseudomonas sp. ANT_H14]|nr:hypothetical protein FQ182_20640 [Pseudomonas sp. ANT_H4]KAA0948039.1 hypothetical protein FQ186_24070 [Pseudomonas sp. ANT_H14]
MVWSSHHGLTISLTLLPYLSAPRLGSACPNEGIAPWVAAMGHPWPSAAKPASCRFTHCATPAFGLWFYGQADQEPAPSAFL